ncbi:unnamed protein product [Larinioides sclopetarius]|uniref:Single domain-containing protein n=1 Tax=Larinioides sclopetarius TaxID=280406 RepID=A0AAV1ZK83_9ARAC
MVLVLDGSQRERKKNIGYCENESFGRIPVGETYYNDEACEQIVCSHGFFYGQGCGQSQLVGNPNCRLVARPGHYPDCCRMHVECDEGADMSNVVVSSTG